MCSTAVTQPEELKAGVAEKPHPKVEITKIVFFKVFIMQAGLEIFKAWGSFRIRRDWVRVSLATLGFIKSEQELSLFPIYETENLPLLARENPFKCCSC